MPDLHPTSCWILSCGKTGHDVQSIGVAETLGVPFTVIDLRPGPLVDFLAPWWPAASDRRLRPPWPDLLIASGRQTIPYARTVRRNSDRTTFTVILQDPVISPGHFDLVWTNSHDCLTGTNVIATPASPHRLTRDILSAEAATLAARLPDLPRPHIGILIGGASRAYRFGREEAQQFAADLKALAQSSGGSLIVTPSRRTGADNEALLRQALADISAWIWHGTGDNPIHGILGHCDGFVVTADSVNMIGEAAYTGKPVFGYRLPGGKEKFNRFHQAMIDIGAMRWFGGQFESWNYDPPHANPVIAEAILKRYAAHTGHPPPR